MRSHNHLVVMAGGIGSRFWPMSTPACPKQFIDVMGVGQTLLQMSVDRFGELIPAENVWVVTSRDYKALVAEQLPAIPESNILLEPCMRNTAPCIAYVAWKIGQRDPEANLVISPADHLVLDKGEFQRVIRSGLAFIAEQENRILTLGMLPTRPETGYGYIQLSDLPAVNGVATGDATAGHGEIVAVKAFREKPDLKTAREYLASGDYCWNAGIFLWSVKTIERAFRGFEPAMAAQFDLMSKAFYTTEEQGVVDRLFPTCKSISIDYAVMERVTNSGSAGTSAAGLSLYVYPASFGWSDLGTWGSLHTQLPHDAAANATAGGEVRLIESSNCVVRMPEGKRVVIQGLDGYIVAEKDDTLLICKLSEEQRIKEFSK